MLETGRKMMRWLFRLGLLGAGLLTILIIVLLIIPTTRRPLMRVSEQFSHYAYRELAERFFYAESTAVLVNTAELLQADELHDQGVTGEGVVVAILDTGVDTSHPDLINSVVAEACFLTNNRSQAGGDCPDGSGRQFGQGAGVDDAYTSHGTHLAGIIASNGQITNVGIAPDADLVSLKILNQNTVYRSINDIVAALEYIVTDLPEVDVVNLSIVSSGAFSEVCNGGDRSNRRLEAVVQTLNERGVLIFGTAGNDYSGDSINSPACYSGIIAVGSSAVNSDGNEFVVPKSNSNHLVEMVFPGEEVLSTVRNSETAVYGGTSMATAHASGCAALLLSTGKMTPQEVKDHMVNSPIQLVDSKNGLAFPRPVCRLP